MIRYMLMVGLGIMAVATAAAKKNVLFIAVDDLRPELGCYGHPMIKSPNIDKLAAEGMRFDGAYCQQAVCAPSRISLLSGRRPDTTGVYDLQTPISKVHPEFVTMPKHFRNNGYETVSIGKIYHHRNDDIAAWSIKPIGTPGFISWHSYVKPETLAAQKAAMARMKAEYAAKKKAGKKLKPLQLWRVGGPSHECADVADNKYPDGMAADRAIEQLRRLKDKPFFIALGFVKPHLPFNAPKKYWDLYDPAKIKLPTVKDWPKDTPSFAPTNWGELRSYTDIPRQGKLGEEKTRRLIHGYYACVSYTDAQVGRVLAELDRLGLRDNTIVILWGDHGWKLGEYSGWCKHTNYEIDTHVPMILRVPGGKPGRTTSALVEYVDIAPTLAELCGLPVLKDWEGTSMVPLLDDPNRKWKTAVFSQYPRGKVMGYTMRTARYRYTEWINRKTKEVVARELYDHAEATLDMVNIVGNPENAVLVKHLHKQMAAGWKAARPVWK